MPSNNYVLICLIALKKVQGIYFVMPSHPLKENPLRNCVYSFIQNASNSKMKKKTTKTQEAKKILKKKFKVNTRIVFTEDGEVG